MEYRERILSMIRTSGPTQPLKVAKALGTNSTLASAMLSEMLDKGLLRVSNIKVGSSPLYFIVGQESALLNYASVLNEKDRRTLELLKEKHVLRDSVQEPLIRVSVRELKDFAKPLEVAFEGKTEIFWKWYLLSDDDAKRVIGEILEPPEQTKTSFVPIPEKRRRQRLLTEVVDAPIIEGTKSDATQLASPIKPSPIEKEEVRSAGVAPLDPFVVQCQTFFGTSNIRVLEIIPLKKSECAFVVNVPSPVGELQYFCKAQSKKRISEGDVSMAFVQGQQHKLPVLYLVQGTLTKRALAFSETLKGFQVHNLSEAE